MGIIERTSLAALWNLIGSWLTRRTRHPGHRHSRHLRESHTLHSHHCCHRIVRIERWETRHHGEATGLLRGELLALLLRSEHLTMLLGGILLTLLHLMPTHEVATTTSARAASSSLHSAILEPTIIVFRLPLESLVKSSFAVRTARSDSSPRATGGILRGL